MCVWIDQQKKRKKRIPTIQYIHNYLFISSDPRFSSGMALGTISSSVVVSVVVVIIVVEDQRTVRAAQQFLAPVNDAKYCSQGPCNIPTRSEATQANSHRFPRPRRHPREVSRVLFACHLAFEACFFR